MVDHDEAGDSSRDEAVRTDLAKLSQLLNLLHAVAAERAFAPDKIAVRGAPTPLQ